MESLEQFAETFTPTVYERAIERNTHGFAMMAGRMLANEIVKNILLEEKYEAAKYDAMTGVYNFQGLMEEGNKLFENDKQYLSVLFLDVDGLKKVNDSLGHAAGDKLITCAARTIYESTRRSDIVGRKGGDEFIVVLNRKIRHESDISLTKEEQANRVTKRTKKTFIETVNQLGIPAKGISIGVVHYDPEIHHSFDDMIHYADLQMYKDKNNTSSEAA